VPKQSAMGRAGGLRGARVLIFIALAASASSSCGSSPRNTRNYQAAAGGLAAVAVTTIAYRAATGSCYAMCRPGYSCDRQSGLCIQTECSPECPEGTRCVRDPDDRLRCEDDGLTMSLMKASRAASWDAGAFSTGADAGLP
jgi:hypothetical protein